VEKVEEGFLELMSTCPKENEEGYIFSDYILYILRKHNYCNLAVNYSKLIVLV